MATVQSLKKKLQVIRSTRKLTQAMKTASTVKYSKLSGLYSAYALYEKQYAELYSAFGDSIGQLFADVSENAPSCYIVISSNKGMCGSFNTELMSFFLDLIKKEEKPIVISCGKKAEEILSKNSITAYRSYIFSDIPQYAEANGLFNDIQALFDEKRISSLKLVYPEYQNMIKQSPVCRDLFEGGTNGTQHKETLFVPDRETVIKGFTQKVVPCLIYKKILEAALGAQAATLTTMRSAFDTASEYCVTLEAEINRKRQSQVTADVIEVSAEYAMKGE